MERYRPARIAARALMTGALAFGAGACGDPVLPTPEHYAAHETSSFRSFIGADVRIHSEGDFVLEPAEFDQILMQSLEFVEEAPDSAFKDELLRVKHRIQNEQMPFSGKTIDIVIADDPALCIKKGSRNDVFGFARLPEETQAQIDDVIGPQAPKEAELCDPILGFMQTIPNKAKTVIAIAPVTIGPTDPVMLLDHFDVVDLTTEDGTEPFIGYLEETYRESVERALRHELRHALGSYDTEESKDFGLDEETFNHGMDFLYAQKTWKGN